MYTPKEKKLGMRSAMPALLGKPGRPPKMPKQKPDYLKIRSAKLGG